MNPARPSRTGAAALLAIGILAIFFLPALATRQQFLFRDAGRLHAPAKLYLASELWRGSLPEWNPYEGLGVPRVAGAVDAVLHPFTVLLLLPFPVAFKLWVLGSFLAAWLGAWRWARRLGCSIAAASAAGAAFALSGHLVGASDNLQYLTSLAALPWIFAAADAWFASGGPWRLAGVGLASYLGFAAGDLQAAGFALLALPFYALLVRAELPWPTRLLRGSLAVVAGLAAAAPVILPTLAWLPHTVRSGAVDAAAAGQWNLAPLRLIELGLPHLFRYPEGSLRSELFLRYGSGGGAELPWASSIYVGVSVLAFAAAGLASSKTARVLGAGALLALWAALGPHAGFSQTFGRLPFLQGFRYWEKMAIWPALLLAIASAVGFDAVLASARLQRGLRWGVGICGLVAAALAAFGGLAPERLASLVQRGPAIDQAARLLSGNLAEGALHLTAVAAALLLVLALSARSGTRWLAPLLVAVVAVDVGVADTSAYQLLDPEVVWPASSFGERLRSEPGLHRILTLRALEVPWRDLPPQHAFQRASARMLEPCWNQPYRVAAFYYYEGLKPRRATELTRHYLFEAPLSHLTSLGVWSLDYLVAPTSVDPQRDLGLAAPAIVATDDAPPSQLIALPHRPRAYLAGALQSVDEAGAWTFAKSDPMASELSVVEGPVPSGYRPPQGSARIERDGPDRVEVSVQTDSVALLILNDAFAPGWSATVDSEDTAISAANLLARGVWVGPGTHQVDFTYRTPGLRPGVAMAMAFWMGLLAWGALRRRRRSAAV